MSCNPDQDNLDEPGNSAKINAAVRSMLAAELDPQHGRARRAFEQHVASGGMSSNDVAMPIRQGRRHGWVIGTVGLGLAASVAAALLWALPRLREQVSPSVAMPSHEQGRPDESMNAPATPGTLPSLLAQDDSRWTEATSDVTTVLMPADTLVVEGHTPARFVRQVGMERREWFDEQRGVRVEAVVPREEVRLIKLDTY